MEHSQLLQQLHHLLLQLVMLGLILKQERSLFTTTPSGLSLLHQTLDPQVLQELLAHKDLHQLLQGQLVFKDQLVQQERRETQVQLEQVVHLLLDQQDHRGQQVHKGYKEFRESVEHKE
jgi:hypothetical protein